MHSDLGRLAARQADVVAAWQLTRLGSPRSVLSHGSAAACWGFYRFQRGYEIVTRPGQAGPRRHGALLVIRSTVLEGDVTKFDGIPITSAARALIDIAPGLDDKQLGRAFRESIRLKRTTTGRIRRTLERHRGRAGTAPVRALATRYSHIPYARTRSDAEGRALEVLHDAGVEIPEVNIKVAGEEADLVFERHKRIIEIDGPQYHLFRDEDARKETAWEGAGYEVHRLPSDDVYDAPDELIARAG